MTTTVEQVLIARLLATAALTALIGQRVYFGLGSQDAATPYLVFAQISGTRISAWGSDTGLVRARYQCTAFGADADTVKDVIVQTRGALQRYRATANGITVYDCLVDNELGPLFDNVAMLESYVMDFIVWHTEN